MFNLTIVDIGTWLIVLLLCLLALMLPIAILIGAKSTEFNRICINYSHKQPQETTESTDEDTTDEDDEEEEDDLPFLVD